MNMNVVVHACEQSCCHVLLLENEDGTLLIPVVVLIDHLCGSFLFLYIFFFFTKLLVQLASVQNTSQIYWTM